MQMVLGSGPTPVWNVAAALLELTTPYDDGQPTWTSDPITLNSKTFTAEMRYYDTDLTAQKLVFDLALVSGGIDVLLTATNQSFVSNCGRYRDNGLTFKIFYTTFFGGTATSFGLQLDPARYADIP